MPISRRNKTHHGLFKTNNPAPSHPLRLLEHPRRSLRLRLAQLSPTDPGWCGAGNPSPGQWLRFGREAGGGSGSSLPHGSSKEKFSTSNLTPRPLDCKTFQ